MQFADEYTFALAEYVNTCGAVVLPAVELARQASGEGLSASAILDIHLRAAEPLQHFSRGRRSRPETPGEVESDFTFTLAFFRRILAAYDVANAQLTSTNCTLQQLNEALEIQANRITHALHDDAGQLLTIAFIKLARAEKKASPECAAHLEEVRSSLASVEQQLRRFSHELEPIALRHSGLLSALEFLVDGVAERTGLKVDLDYTQVLTLPKALQSVIYRFVQEALTNVFRHAGAIAVKINFLRTDDHLTCTVSDDGVGFDTDVCDFGMGLSGMQQQVKAANGSFKIRSSPGLGSDVIAQFSLSYLNSEDNRLQPFGGASPCDSRGESEEPEVPWVDSILVLAESPSAKRTVPEATNCTEPDVMRARCHVKMAATRDSIPEFKAKTATDLLVRQFV